MGDEVAVIGENALSFEEFRREVLAELADKGNRLEMAEESVTDLLLQLENIGWKPLSEVGSLHTGPTLAEAIKVAGNCRTVFTGNPVAERGVQIRRGYVWGSGVDIRSKSSRTAGIPSLTDKNQRSLFSQRAMNELEFAAATDGNIFMLMDSTTKRVVRVPMSEIGGYATDPDDVETITHYKRVWNRVTTQPDGTPKSEAMECWYPAHDATPKQRGQKFTSSTNNTQVKAKASQAMIQVSFNTHMHWQFGLPDLFNVLVWISAYKTYLEAGFSVTKALARFAVKVTTPTVKGANRAAASIAAPLGAPGTTTSAREYGQAAMASGGTDVSAISKSGAEFDFESGEALAALIAAGLGIDVDDLLSKTQQVGDNQISLPTVKSIIARQQEWDDFLSGIARFMGTAKPNITFPPVRAVAVHRALQAVVLAATTNTLWPDEVRVLVAQMLGEYGFQANGKGVPEDGMWAKFTSGVDAQANIDAANQAAKDAADQADDDQPADGDPAHPGTKPLNTPKGAGKATAKGKRTPAGALADGDNSQRNSNK